MELIVAHGDQLQRIETKLGQLHRSSSEGDSWLDAKRAAEYLDVSSGTFDKLRYKAHPRLKGYRVGGKTLYKKSELDQFVKLYDVRAEGIS